MLLKSLNKEIFKIKDLEIVQDRKRQLISVDSLLLEQFIRINRKSKKILEIGIGTGIISLLLMKRTTADIIGIDIDEKMCELSSLNYNLNYEKLRSKNLKIINSNFNEYDFNNELFDIIFTNPPYFKTKDIFEKENENIKNARSEYLLKIEDIFFKGNKLLKNGSKLYIIFRADRLDEILELANKNKLTPKRMQLVYTNQKYAKFVLLECIKNDKNSLLIEKPIILFENGKNTDFLDKLYK